MSGYVWEVTSSTDSKWRVHTAGYSIDEALQKFREDFDHEIDIFKIVYLFKLGKHDDDGR
jgi:hypothetical protein